MVGIVLWLLEISIKYDFLVGKYDFLGVLLKAPKQTSEDNKKMKDRTQTSSSPSLCYTSLIITYWPCPT